MITPPSSEPIEPPDACTKLCPPSAFARSAGTGNSATTMPSATPDTIAPLTPCRKRAATRRPAVGASPHSSDATVNTAMPATNILLRPNRSPRRPAGNSRPPKGITYAFTTQARPVPEKPRSARIAGRATLTTVWSTTIISVPALNTANAYHRDIPLRLQRCTTCNRRNDL
ncbi:hypothetical protein CLV71_11012 [Actinophytocola oryzae]|uniref:Uncharacterized protein n=1 Tax=Actinophytocola oryzae TaxID=502181 RepID=A0A4R7VCK7_9PSEU|nr:hypothetical protein CLV71_11012 [Actinophytocola oryzae]